MLTKKRAIALATKILAAPRTVEAVARILQAAFKGAGQQREKGASGEREAAKAIMAHTCLNAERLARNGKQDSDVLVWPKCRKCMGKPSDGHCACHLERPKILEVKRVESLDIGTAQMAKYREQAEKDGAIGILWRKNRGAWRLECLTAPWRAEGDPMFWATYSGDDVWRVLEALV